MNEAFEETGASGASDSDVFARYDRWNTAIAGHFFTPDAAQHSVRLAFDDEAAATIGRAFDESADDLANILAQLVQPDAGDEMFALFERLSEAAAYDKLALMAAQVLAASRMGEDPTADVKSYWPIFAGIIGTDLNIRQRERLSGFWFECERFYRDDLRGTLGMLSIPPNHQEMPLSGKIHINLPLWQCTLREADREQLRRRFQIASASDLGLDPDRLPALAREWPELNRTLKNTLRWAAENREFEHQLGLLMDDVRAFSRTTLYVSETRKHVASRLRLAGRNLGCWLQTRNPCGEWLDVGPGGHARMLTPEEIIDGVDAETFGGSWVGAERMAFLKGPYGFTILRGGINGAANVVFLLRTADVFSEALSAHGWSKRVLDTAIREDFVAFEGRIEPNRDEELAASFGVEMVRERCVALEGGLPIGRRPDRVYLTGAPPRVRIMKKVAGALYIGERRIEIEGRNVVALPHLLCGDQEIRYGDDVITITLRDEPETANEDGAHIGWILERSGQMRVGDADASDEVVLIGAEARL